MLPVVNPSSVANPNCRAAGQGAIARDALLIAHLSISALAVLLTYRAIQAQSWSGTYLLGQLLYAGVCVVLILRLRSLDQLLRPSGFFVAYTYLAYFVKSVVYLFDPELYLRNWITLNSPLAHATLRDWSLAMAAAAGGLVLFCLGYWLSGSARAARQRPPSRPSSCPLAVLLGCGALLVLLRVFVTWQLGVGASYDAARYVLLVPGLSGFLSLLSVWGGRMVIGAALAVAIARRSSFGVAAAAIEMLALGLLGTIATGSKSELLLAVVVVLAVSAAMRTLMPRRFWLGAAAAGVVLAGVVFVYPAFHEYRYVRRETDVGTYLRRHRFEMGLAAGGKDVLRRLNGLEYLAMVVVYYEFNGARPPVQLNYQPFIRTRLFGVPEQIVTGLGVGPFGGLLLVGGWRLLPALCLLLGVLLRLLDNAVERTMVSRELRAAVMAVCSIAALNHLMFSGHFASLAKDLVAIVCSAACLATADRLFGNSCGSLALQQHDRGVIEPTGAASRRQ